MKKTLFSILLTAAAATVFATPLAVEDSSDPIEEYLVDRTNWLHQEADALYQQSQGEKANKQALKAAIAFFKLEKEYFSELRTHRLVRFIKNVIETEWIEDDDDYDWNPESPE